MKKISLIIASVLFSTSAFAQSSNPPGDSAYWEGGINAAPSDLSKDAVMSSNVEDWIESSTIDTGRAQIIESSAVRLGSQAGYSARTQEIQNALLQRADSYDRAFDFSRIMIKPGFLPPVITEGRDAYNQPNDNEARAADRIYRIERPARLVSAPPSWRSYLLSPATPAIKPDPSVLPINKEESKVWDRAAAEGWNQGAKLADRNFEANLARLKQDFQGMVRFKMLYEQGLVNMPVAANSPLGVTGGGDEMAINDRIIRVTEGAALDANTKNWKSTRPKTSEKDR